MTTPETVDLALSVEILRKESDLAHGRAMCVAASAVSECPISSPRIDVAGKAPPSPPVNTRGAEAAIDPSAMRAVKRSSAPQVKRC